MRRTGISVAAALVAAGLVTAAPAVATGGSMQCDFDGDGYDDLAIGVPYEDVGSNDAAGAVNVIYGSADRLIATGDQIWDQDSPGIDDSAEPYDYFGATLECGNFNRDQYADLAVGVMGEDIGAETDVGAFHVLFGSPDGLTATDSQFFTRAAPGVADDALSFDYFGSALAAGDFDGDGDDDLAVAAMFDDIPGFIGAGSVQVFKSNSGGISTAGDIVWHLDTPGIKGDPGTYDGWGGSLATGDINGDGYADLLVGNPFDDTDSIVDHGSFNVIYGSPTGLDKDGDQHFDRSTPRVMGDLASDVWLGRFVALGDLDGDGYDDAVVGAPYDDIAGSADAGSIQVMFGGPNGLRTAGDRIIDRDTTGIRGSAGEGDTFGRSLTVARLDKDKYADIVVGVPFDDVGGITNAGSVHVIYGSAAGPTGAGDQIWHQDKKGVRGSNEDGDWFGYSVATGDFNGNGRYDIAAGVPREDGATAADSGKVEVLYGRSKKVTAKGDQSWSQDSVGIEGVGETSDRMGNTLDGTNGELD
jgi:FG-GAP repeat